MGSQNMISWVVSSKSSPLLCAIHISRSPNYRGLSLVHSTHDNIKTFQGVLVIGASQYLLTRIRPDHAVPWRPAHGVVDWKKNSVPYLGRTWLLLPVSSGMPAMIAQLERKDWGLHVSKREWSTQMHVHCWLLKKENRHGNPALL